MPVRLSLKPISNNLSASSIINISRDLKFNGEEGDVMTSWSRPGVPIRIVGCMDFKIVISFAIEEVPPMSKVDDKIETSSAGRAARKPCSTE